VENLLKLEEFFPGGELLGGIELANRLDWGLSLQLSGVEWVVFSGGQPIYKTDCKESLHSFVYGLGLAYAVLPRELFDQLVENVKNL
jgi:hypothetical protein